MAGRYNSRYHHNLDKTEAIIPLFGIDQTQQKTADNLVKDVGALPPAEAKPIFPAG